MTDLRVAIPTELPPEEKLSNPLAQWLPFGGLIVAGWAVLPKYAGPTPGLTVAPGREVVDHVVPAMIVLAASVVAFLVLPVGRKAGPSLLMAGFAVLLAGLWMGATHFPLLAQAARGEAPWPATIFHGAAAAAVLGFGLLWSSVCWADGARPVPATERAGDRA